MSDSLLAVIFIPIVVAIALACWIFAVFHANRHPDSGPGKMPRREVIGGAFRASGGRQVMPRRDAPADTAEEASSAAEAVSSADQAPAGPQTATDADRQGRRDAGHPAGL
jgi:hypothetical protein